MIEKIINDEIYFNYYKKMKINIKRTDLASFLLGRKTRNELKIRLSI